jgi:putative phosphoesterase
VAELAAADLIVHLGDFVELGVLESLGELGSPIAAVHGNVDAGDLRRLLPAERIIEVEGVRLGLIHDAGPAHSRLERMRRRFPDVHAVLFGHTHMPSSVVADGLRIFNPGSPTERRRAPSRSMGIGVVRDGRMRLRHLDLD